MSRQRALHPAWSGKKVTEAHALVATWLPAPCGKCGKTVAPGDAFVTGHKLPRWSHPHLTWEVSNWQPEHDACSRASAQQEVIAKARREGAEAERARMGLTGSPSSPPPHTAEGSARVIVLDSSGRDFSHGDTSKESPLLSISPFISRDDLPTVREDLEWDAEALSAYDWLQPFLEIPDNASPPLWMSRPPEDATGSYGAEAIKWTEETQGITLRWWQRLAIVRQLEHGADGSLCHREVLESTPRRAGKSVRMRVTALWRLQHGPGLFGETQLVMHTGSDMAICREIQRQAWRWAEDTAKWTVMRANGKESIETKHGDRWLVRAQGAVYGYDITLGLADEAWDVSPECIAEGIEPATLERLSPQLHLTSTAHRRATSLMRGRLSAALATEDPETLLMVWAAPHGSDPSDPEVWRAASPHWTEDRRKLIANKHAKALAGEQDPELDDPDPMAGFASQYLNIWRLSERRSQKGTAIIEAGAWEALTAPAPWSEPPTAAAIEGWPGASYSLALAWKVGDRAHTSVTEHPDLASAVGCLRASGFRRTAIVGTSLAADPALTGVPKRTAEGRTGQAASDLRRLITEDAIRHDGGEHLTRQVTTLRTTPGADGPRMASAGRADAVKALVRAAQAARSARALGKPRIILPRGHAR